MAFKIIRDVNNRHQTGREIVAVLDSDADLYDLGVNFAPGSTAIVAQQGGNTYVTNASGEWTALGSESGSSGGSGLPSGAKPNQYIVTDGEGNAKWEDKLCWGETLVLLKESDAVEREDSYFGKTWLIENAPELEIGKTYTVKYNGVDYSCVCQKAPSHVTDDDNAVAMGNFSAAGGDDTGEPFAMMISPEFNSVNVIDLSGASSVKVGIVEEVVHTINKKYLPTSGICLRFSPHEEGRGEYIGEYAPASVLQMIREDITIPIVFAMPTMDYDYYYKPISFLDRGPNSYITADFIGKGGSNMTMKIGSDEICLYFV